MNNLEHLCEQKIITPTKLKQTYVAKNGQSSISKHNDLDYCHTTIKFSTENALCLDSRMIIKGQKWTTTAVTNYM